MPITYVDNRFHERDWKPAPPIAVMTTIRDYLAMPVSGDVLIIHGGQPDARLTAPGGRPLLLEAVLRVCKGGGRAVIFSGGQPAISVADLREALGRESLVEGLHYLLLTAIQNLEHELDVELLKTIRPSSDWRIADARRRYAVSTLLTLGLLCQSALLAFESKDVLDDAAALLGGREVMDEIRTTCASSPEQLLTPIPWHGALGTQSAAIYTAIDAEWPHGVPSYRSLRALIDVLFEQPRALDAVTVSLAFVELYQALQKNQELQH
jgi:hypothetical protein